jgi:hypothetical protein
VTAIRHGAPRTGARSRKRYHTLISVLGYPGFRKVADNTFNTVAGTPEANFSSATGPNNLLFLGPYTVLSNPLALVDGIQCAMTRSNRILTKPKPTRSCRSRSDAIQFNPSRPDTTPTFPTASYLSRSHPSRPGPARSNQSQAAWSRSKQANSRRV